jgi:hypothetical protein
MPKFRWLHLTDLHYRLSDQRPLWPNVTQAFFDDLGRLHEHCGPWQAILFTGDFVQSGAADDFKRLDADVLTPLWGRLQELGSEPVLLAVPGNHDLVRPEPAKPPAALRQLLRKGGFHEIADEFWSEPTGEYRQIIDTALANFLQWWRRTPFRGNAIIREGMLPGDFSTTIEIDGMSIGVVGLNTTFLQLAGGDYRERLVWDVRQLNAACTGDPHGDAPGWIRAHDASLLLTHQGPEWLDRPSREDVYSEINPAGRFAVHLFGHMHENAMRGSTAGGGPMLWQWQGCSIFGLEHYGDPPKSDRRHGYAVGQIEFETSSASIRHWPRLALKDPNGWRFERDTRTCMLNESDGGTKPWAISVSRRASGKASPSRLATATGTPLSITERQALDAYVDAARSLWDIIDLAGLPEDDRHLAMQRFLLRQLFVPRRGSWAIAR